MINYFATPNIQRRSSLQFPALNVYPALSSDAQDLDCSTLLLRHYQWPAGDGICNDDSVEVEDLS